MTGGRFVPRLRLFQAAGGMGRTPRPIGATGAAHRELDGFVHGHEVVHGDCVVVQETQGDPAGQPFGLGEVAPACEAVFPG